MLDHTDDLIRNSADPKLVAERGEAGIEELRHFVADDDDGRAELDLLWREGATAAQVVLLDGEVVALDRVRIDLARSRIGRRRPQVVLALDCPASPVRQHGGDGAD